MCINMIKMRLHSQSINKVFGGESQETNTHPCKHTFDSHDTCAFGSTYVV